MTESPLQWRTSTYSSGTNSCVEVAKTDGGVLVRNSNHPDAGTILFTPAEMAAWVKGCAAGEFDDLAN
jgi:Domain of unknown function (DUF397)